MNDFQLKSLIVTAEAYNLARRSCGLHTINAGTDIAEWVSASLMSDLNGQSYEVAVTSTKGYDISTSDGHKVEVKSVASMHRNIGNLKDKRGSDQIIVIWWAENTLIRVERVMIYTSTEVLEAVKMDGNKKGLFTYKMQKEWIAAGRGQDLTQQFQAVLDRVMEA